MTLTIELPEDLAEKLAPMTTRDRNNFAIAALREKEQDKSRSLPPLPEPGFAYDTERLAREAAGDFRTPGEIHIANRRIEWQARDARLYAYRNDASKTNEAAQGDDLEKTV